jgi:RNA recognition motif-containing protein
MTIFIGNLSWETEVADLEQLFSNYGVVKKCYLPLDRETGRKRGIAFVDLNDHNSEKKAIDDLQDVEWMGREIRVNEAEKRNGPIIKNTISSIETISTYYLVILYRFIKWIELTLG